MPVIEDLLAEQSDGDVPEEELENLEGHQVGLTCISRVLELLPLALLQVDTGYDKNVCTTNNVDDTSQPLNVDKLSQEDEGEFPEGEEEEEEGDDSAEDDDEEGWITPNNIKTLKARREQGKMNANSSESVKVACLTTDFAMQV